MFPLHLELKDHSAFRIELASPAKAEAHVEFQRRAAASTDMMRTEAHEYPSADRLRELLAKAAEDGLSLFLTGWREERIIASLTIHRTHHARTLHAGLLGMMVDEHYRGLGAGKLMLEAGIRWARANGLRKIDLHVRQDNLAAIAMYRKAGFEKEGVMRRGLKVGERLLDVDYMGLCID